MNNPPRYIILDRDGTIIRHVHYLGKPEQVTLLPTVIEGLKELIDGGCVLFLHTNQSGVGRGYFSLDDVIACNTEMLRQIGLGRDLFEDICVCPEAPDQDVSYRKPSPNYGLELIRKHSISREELCYIGDNLTDLMTAKNLGCRGVGVNTGLNDLRRSLREGGFESEFPVFDRFVDAVRHILGSDPNCGEVQKL